MIHHTFVVVDFNGENPAVFTGSSNLAQGREASNGNNLLAITEGATSTKRLQLEAPVAKGTKAWWSKYYDEDNRAYNERERLSLPMG